MLTGKIHMFNRRTISLLLMIAGISFLLAGCVGANLNSYGKIIPNRDLNNRFLNYEVLPDHKYYTAGGYDKPDAILAIHADYELDNTETFWRVIPDVNYWQMRKWIDTIAPEQDYRYSSGYFAAYILDPDGKRIGAWYSVENRTTVKFLEGNRVLVFTPDPRPDMDLRRMHKEITE